MKKHLKNNYSNLNIENTYLELTGPGWRKPVHINIKSIPEILDIEPSNVKLVTFDNQDSSITKPPESLPVDEKLHISLDGNFLYVWVIDRWKRVALSNF